MNMKKVCITTLLLTSFILSLNGCATSGDRSVLPDSGPTMQQIYNHQINHTSDAGALDQVRNDLPPASYVSQKSSQQKSYKPENRDHRVGEQNSQVGEGSPNMLPNPMIQIYVYPHFDGNDQDYVPGHTAYVKLYQKTHFALPGEPSEATES